MVCVVVCGVSSFICGMVESIMTLPKMASQESQNLRLLPYLAKTKPKIKSLQE
jgi:hypothetical protein